MEQDLATMAIAMYTIPLVVHRGCRSGPFHVASLESGHLDSFERVSETIRLPLSL